jgi:hypothetical protein
MLTAARKIQRKEVTEHYKDLINVSACRENDKKSNGTDRYWDLISLITSKPWRDFRLPFYAVSSRCSSIAFLPVALTLAGSIKHTGALTNSLPFISCYLRKFVCLSSNLYHACLLATSLYVDQTVIFQSRQVAKASVRAYRTGRLELSGGVLLSHLALVTWHRSTTSSTFSTCFTTTVVLHQLFSPSLDPESLLPKYVSKSVDRPEIRFVMTEGQRQ